MADGLDPRTPVLVGAGQSSDPIDGPGYRRLSPVDLAAEAARAALSSTGAAPAAVATAIDTVAAIWQFEISVPGAVPPFGGSDNPPRSVAVQIGADPRRAILEVTGGQGPQHLVTELAGAIRAGDADIVLVCGAQAMSTVRHLAGGLDAPDWTETVGGQLEDRGFGLRGLITQYQVAHGLFDAPAQYALFENARRARLGLSRTDYAAAMGALFAPFTEMAKTNPHAAAPVSRTADELATVTERNRMVVEPYPRLLVARDAVNLGAAVLLMSVARARELGVPEDRWVFLRDTADVTAPTVLEREDLSEAGASVLAVREALATAGIAVEDLTHLDLYSCCPVAVSTICDGLGLAEDDPRGFTVTGGLPYFGGPGNDYSLHAIDEVVDRCRAEPGTFGLVGANGGVLSKYSVGVYATTQADWRPGTNTAQREVDGWPRHPVTLQADGTAVIETWTVTYSKKGRTAIVVGRLEATGERFLATTAPGDEATLAVLDHEQPVGARLVVRSFGFGNRVAVDEVRMDGLFPPRPPGLRAGYEHLLVRRDGHLLEVTINRPDRRNCLHPAANAELEEVFDAYFAHPEMWVAILTGAGDRAFCAGNDLVHMAGGKQVWVPKTGFGGLTCRENREKPVIAAVNGPALAGGFEIVLACDLVVAAENAEFALTEVKVGLVAALGGIARLPRVIGPTAATEMILTGRRVDAREARELGLVNRVVPAGGALAGARELAAEILAASPTSVRLSMRAMAAAAPEPDAALAGLEVPEDTPAAARGAVAMHEAGLSPVVLPAPPLIHGTAFYLSKGSWLLGGTVVLLENRRLDGHELWGCVQRERVTQVIIVGDPFARAMVRALEESERAGTPYDISSLRRIASSGVLWSDTWKQPLVERGQITLTDMVGASEGGPFTMQVVPPGARAAECRFEMTPRARLIDEHGALIDPASGRTGRLAVPPPGPLGYHKDPAKSASLRTEIDGVTYTVPGDYAYLDERGEVVLLGRGALCINTGGENVYPQEVETAIAGLDGGARRERHRAA